MNKPKITVYIPSHNYGKYLETAIESVLRQSVDNWELLVIDDNSTDNTSNIMELYKGDSRVKLFTTSGIGLPAVCNLALKKARGDYIIRLDADDIFDENILLVLGNYLNINPDYAMVFSDYYLINENGEIFSHEKREKLYVNNHILDIPANGACCLIRKSVLEGIGGYREDLGAQDGYDVWLKIKDKYKVSNINLPLFYYRRHGQNMTNRSHHIFAARYKIKYDNIKNRASDFRPIIAIIPCRKNYDFCQDLWKRKISGKSLLQLDIEKCVKSQLFDHIVVASDNSEVKEIISLFNDSRLSFFQRKTEDTIRSQSLAITIEKTVSLLDPGWKGLSGVSYLQAPFVSIETMEEAIFTLILNNADCAFGVEEIKDPLFKRSPFGLQAINQTKGFNTDFDVIYRETNTSLTVKNSNIKVGSLTGPSVVNFLVKSEEVFFIESEHKLKIADILMRSK